MSAPLFDPALAERVSSAGVVAVLVIDRAEDAAPLAQALLEGGVNVMELTLRTPAALDALVEIRGHVPDMVAGIGTILTVEQLLAASAAGAAFGVSPGCNPRVLAAAREAGLSFAPGIATPTDVEMALEHGCRLLKFFPAECLPVALPQGHRRPTPISVSDTAIGRTHRGQRPDLPAGSAHRRHRRFLDRAARSDQSQGLGNHRLQRACGPEDGGVALHIALPRASDFATVALQGAQECPPRGESRRWC